MMKRYLLPATPLAAMLLLTGCMDDNYDLSNVNTTTQVNVKGLVIPVNLDQVTLDQVIDLDSDSEIQVETVNGQKIYVYTYPKIADINKPNADNKFHSDDIKINPFTVATNPITPTEVTVKLDVPAPAEVSRRAPAEAIAYVVENDTETDFTFDINDIESVETITKLGTPDENNKKLRFDVKITFPQPIVSKCQSIYVEKLQIQFPEGLNGTSPNGTYDKATDILTVTDTEVQNGVLDILVTSTEIALNADLNGGDSFTYEGKIVAKEGSRILLTMNSGVTADPKFTITSNYALSNFEITKFSGKVNYDTDLSINPISLENLPDFLTEEGTNLVLGDPQLYIALNNPVSSYDLVATTDMAFYQQRNGVVDTQHPMALPGGLTVNDNESNEYVHHYALSPAGTALQIPDVSYLAAYQTPATIKQAYPALSDVLAGNGLPEALNVKFDGTKVTGTTEDFELGKNIKGLQGSYIFRAPLTLKDGSQIIKSGNEDDWSSEDLDRLNVEELQLNTTVTSTLPMSVKLTAQVRNTAGQHVGKCVPVEIPAMATDYPVVLTIDAVDGKYINNIDGVYYEATMLVPGNQDATLSPDQTLVLKDVRAKVTGFYLYEDK